MKRLMTCMMVLWLLAAGGPAGARTAHELDQAGLDHFGKGFYEATPRGEHARAAEEYRLAEQSFEEAIRGRPDWVEPYLHLGRAYFVQGKYRQAARVYEEALKVAPERKEIYTQWASALEQAGDYEGAARVLQTLRARETDERAKALLDTFIGRLEARSRAVPANREGGR